MRFYFDLDIEEFHDDNDPDFKNRIHNEVIDVIAEQYLEDQRSEQWHKEINADVREIIRQHSKELCQLVVEKVADKIEHKKAVLDITPKASDLAAMDRSNEQYFIELIDKAIARRFGK